MQKRLPTLIPELTGLRCLAVTMVILGHAAATVPESANGLRAAMDYLGHGGLGVQIFRVLSGFLITTILIGEWTRTGGIRLGRFLYRRAMRIWPAFYVFLAVVALLSMQGALDVAWQQLGFAASHLWNYSAALGLTPINDQWPDGAWYMGHLWSLALEEQFYWFWPPLLIVMLRGKAARLLPALILVIPLVRTASYFLAPQLRGQLQMMLHTGADSIFIGCYAAVHQARIREWFATSPHSRWLANAACAALLMLVPGLTIVLGGYWTATYGTTVSALVVTVIIMAVITLPDFWMSRFLRLRPVMFLGTISYSIYLWQQLFLYIGSPLSLGFPLNLLQVLAAALASYYLIELPTLRWRDRKRGATKAAPVASGAPAAGE